MGSELLTTGQVAKLCGVTPDAVLKWIKNGKLPATRTPGGHYRVSRETCATLGLSESVSGDSDTEVVAAYETPSASARCWEYFGQQGTPREECRSCVVYVARAQNCYRLAELGEEAGHRLNFCATECADCAYYRACRGMATAVLVITRDEALTRRLGKRIDAGKASLRFVRSGYECATAVGTFRPAVVVMDSDLPEVKEGQLPQAIMQDERVPGVTVVVACREGDEEVIGEMGVATIDAPFTAKQIEQLADRAAYRARPAPRDVA